MKRAFTLIELLVVIAVIAVLVGILVPSLASARRSAKMAAELASAQQLGVAFSLYAQESKDQVLPGYPPASWVTPGGALRVLDESGAAVTGEKAQRYPWRIAPYMNYEFRGLYQNIPFLNELRQGAPEYASFGIDWRYLVSLYPALGLNTLYIGGDDQNLGFNPRAEQTFGTFVTRRIDQPRRPSNLIVWASAREGEVSWAPRLGRPEGFFRVKAPNWIRREWDATYDPRSINPGNNSGWVSLRHAGKAVVGMFDGHAETLGWEDLQDMRRWSDAATSATWTLQPRP